MFKAILIVILLVGAFVCLSLIPGAWSTMTHIRGTAVPWIALGLVAFAYIGYKKIS
jgi:hypothetical protein